MQKTMHTKKLKKKNTNFIQLKCLELLNMYKLLKKLILINIKNSENIKKY